LVVNHKNTGHEKDPGLVEQQPMMKMPDEGATPWALFTLSVKGRLPGTAFPAPD
jgi:hypothetical protein